ncbi:MAG: aminotransferase class I/II-fold pyridoxal phosphate-dependent enzyme [Clostridia bacterium]|nr:aminotransferase class I/II-fold pyridoxal phosphate-dependent enzyme [Clostridia bacterium]
MDRLELFPHGGDYTGKYLDFSASLSPLGVPASVRSALAALAEGEGLASYPDPYCTELRRAIAAKEEVTEEAVLCGNGAADLIHRTVRALQPKTALILEPTFFEYEKALSESGCDIRKYYLKENRNEFGNLCADSFGLKEEFLDALTPDLDLVFVCSPNNPTGRSIPEALMERILKTAQENGTIVFWDACFADFCDLEDGADRQAKSDAFLRRSVQAYPNLILLKSFTKTYAIPGLRLGYLLCSDEEKTAYIAKWGAPWSVSTAAQVAGLAALKDETYLQRARLYVSEEKLRVWLALLQLGVFCRRGDGNFLLIRTEREDLPKRLKDRGILVRDCSNFDGLDAHYIRVAIRTRNENDQLLDALWAELEGGETP